MPMEPPSGSSAVERVPAYILAGGRSRRFGSDKARAVIDGRALVSTIAHTVAPFVSSVTAVAARDGQYHDLGLRTIGDVVSDKGPLGGLLTAVGDAGRGWLLVLACDWVGIRGEWIDILLSGRSADAVAVSYCSDRFEPMFALYHTELRPLIVGQLDRGELAMQQLLERARAVRIPLPPGWSDATNLNLPPEGSGMTGDCENAG